MGISESAARLLIEKMLLDALDDWIRRRLPVQFQTNIAEWNETLGDLLTLVDDFNTKVKIQDKIIANLQERVEKLEKRSAD